MNLLIGCAWRPELALATLLSPVAHAPFLCPQQHTLGRIAHANNHMARPVHLLPGESSGTVTALMVVSLLEIVIFIAFLSEHIAMMVAYRER